MKRIYFIFMFIIVSWINWAETSNEFVNNFIKYFNQGDIDTKIQIVETAIKRIDVNMGPFYHVVVDYSVEFPEVIRNNPSMGKILIDSLKEIERLDYRESNSSVFKLFLGATTSTIQLAALDALKVIGEEDKKIFPD